MSQDDRDELDDDGDDGDDGDEREPGARPREAKDELFEALDHFRNAASLLFDKAAKDPTVKNATAEAERAVRKIGATAEPLARQLAEELTKMSKRVGESIQEAVDAGRSRARPAPDAEDDDD